MFLSPVTAWTDQVNLTDPRTPPHVCHRQGTGQPPPPPLRGRRPEAKRRMPASKAGRPQAGIEGQRLEAGILYCQARSAKALSMDPSNQQVCLISMPGPAHTEIERPFLRYSDTAIFFLKSKPFTSPQCVKNKEFNKRTPDQDQCRQPHLPSEDFLRKDTTLTRETTP